MSPYQATKSFVIAGSSPIKVGILVTHAVRL